MITDKDIAKLKKVFATKDDLKNFATKDDLKEIRQEINRFTTKDDLQNLKKDLRKDMRESFTKLIEMMKSKVNEFKSVTMKIVLKK